MQSVYQLESHIWVFPKIGVPQNGWFIMENSIKMHDLGVPLFSETSICCVSSVVLLYQGFVLHALIWRSLRAHPNFLSGNIWKQGFFEQKATKDQPATFSSTNDLV